VCVAHNQQEWLKCFKYPTLVLAEHLYYISNNLDSLYIFKKSYTWFNSYLRNKYTLKYLNQKLFIMFQQKPFLIININLVWIENC